MSTPLSRREAIRRTVYGAAGLWLADNLPVRAWAALPPARVGGKAKSVIQIWMWGGPSHLDTFDPKPETGNDYAGPLKAIETNVSGIRICELMPLLFGRRLQGPLHQMLGLYECVAHLEHLVRRREALREATAAGGHRYRRTGL